ncbi:MAG: gliding motility-associated C-terminal domain-containing protein [Flavobacteriales bacterium]
MVRAEWIFTGTYYPGTSQPGVYKYKRIGTAPCPSDSATVTVFQNTAPDAGISTLAELCSTQGPTPLLNLLGGTPDNNGTWTYNNEEHGPFFDPATDLPGAYVYTVQGQTPCVPASAQVVITLISAPNAGSNGSIPACVGSTAIDLFPALGTQATTGGVWTTDCAQGTLTNGVFDATGLAPGSSCTFTYTHPMTGPCPAVSADVQVNIVEALDAGEDDALDACLGQVVDLFNALGGTPQLGGTWRNVDGANGLSGGFFNTGAVASGTTWRFDYVLAGSVECDPDTARVTVEVLDGPFAGCDGNTSACTTFPPFSLITSLTCGQGSDGPDPGGAWFGPAWAPHSGIFQPAVDASGNYYYVVEGFGSCPADTARVNVNLVTAPNAGVDATLSICSTDPQQGMFALLGPNAQAGGSWFFGPGSGTPHPGVYNPAIDVPGTYRYRVQGAVPCATDEATVIVSEPVAPNAGCDATITVCTSQAPFLLRNQLTCSPSGSGTWTYVTGGNVPHGDSFNPATDPPGVYRHLIIGTSPCASDSADVTISVVNAGNAGQNATIQACASQTEVDLFVQLGPEAQSGGNWTDIDVSQALTGALFNPSLAGNGTWRFRYTIAANGPCPSVFRTVTVVVGGGGSAGQDSSVVVCANESEYDLFLALGGSPTSGGTWSDPTGTGALLSGGRVNAGLLPTSGSSPFVYTINDPNCGLLTAVVQVSAVAFPVAGTGGPVVLCSTAPSIELFFQLTGGPQSGGVWTDPLGEPHGGTFTPGVDLPGNYTYTVPGAAPCADATAIVTMTVNQPPDAGSNGLVTLCDTLLAYPLITGLNGTPNSGGSWADLDGSGGLSGGTLNTTGLAPADYEFRYTVSVPGCTPASSVLKVNVITSPIVTQLTTTCNTVDRTYTVSFTVEQGDADSYEVSGLEGELSSSVPYTFVSVPLITSSTYEAVIRDANGCAEYEIQGGSPCNFVTEVFVPESFSPNGDGVNEAFRIPGIEGYPNNAITIFNRWGGKVFEATGYDNSSVLWDGSSPDALISGNAATGTYFYVLDLGTGAEPITGFIQLVR